MTEQREVTLWPTRENYTRFRDVCDDEIPATFEEFEALASGRITQIENEHGIKIHKVPFDPDRMATWCRVNYGKVDSSTRRLYAGFIALSD